MGRSDAFAVLGVASVATWAGVVFGWPWALLAVGIAFLVAALVEDRL